MRGDAASTARRCRLDVTNLINKLQCSKGDSIAALRVAVSAMLKTDGENHGNSAPDPLISDPVNTEKSSGPPTAEAGCATSFLMQKNNEKGAVCGAVQANPKEEYVQKDEEKELGGEA